LKRAEGTHANFLDGDGASLTSHCQKPLMIIVKHIPRSGFALRFSATCEMLKQPHMARSLCACDSLDGMLDTRLLSPLLGQLPSAHAEDSSLAPATRTHRIVAADQSETDKADMSAMRIANMQLVMLSLDIANTTKPVLTHCFAAWPTQPHQCNLTRHRREQLQGCGAARLSLANVPSLFPSLAGSHGNEICLPGASHARQPAGQCMQSF
jgi:hypothetical protein